MRLLTARSRGREELARALAQRGFTRAAAREALDRLERESWLDDLAAARCLVRARSRRYGRARIERELSARGFSQETIARALGQADGREEDESLERAFRTLWASRAALPADKRRRQVWGALARRGFAAGKISEIMKGFDEVDRGS